MAEQIQIIDSLKQLVSESELKGCDVIPIKVLQHFFNEAWISHENARSNYLHEMRVYEVKAPIEAQFQVEMLKATLEAGQTAVKSLTLINGGAVISILALVGNIATKDASNVSIKISELYFPLMAYVSGVGLAGFASAARYFSQDLYNKSDAWGNGFKYFAIGSGLLSLSAFVCGSYLAGNVLLK